jgi:hypothetical protein
MITIPTLQELITDVISQIEAEFGDTISTTGKSALRATGNTLGGKLKLLYLTLANVQKNMLPDLADSVAVGGTLERWGFIKLGRYPFKATNGEYTLSVTGSVGATIPAQTTFLSDDDSLSPGQLYILDEAYVLVSTTDNINVRALTPGTAGKLNIGDTLTPTSPIALVDSTAVVTAETVQPLDAESIDTYRQEVIASFNLEPQGGADTDYRLWAQDAQGVEAVYPYTASGYSNRVNLYIESSIADSTDGKGTPSAGMITSVEGVINFDPDTTIPLLQRGRKPATVIVNYLPVTIITVDIVIPSFSGITADKQALILSAMTSYYSSIRPFVAAADVIENKNDISDQNNISAVVLSAVPGSSFGAPILYINGVAMTSYTFINGNIPYLNSITYS